MTDCGFTRSQAPLFQPVSQGIVSFSISPGEPLMGRGMGTRDRDNRTRYNGCRYNLALTNAFSI